MPDENANPDNGQFADSGGNQPDTSWFNGLHADFQADPSMQVFKTEDGLNKFAEAHLNLRKKMGTAVWLPKEGATEEELKDFRTKMGVPETPDKYTIQYPQNEALKFDAGMDKAWKDTAHKLGLNNAQGQALTDYYGNIITTALANQGKAFQEESDALRTEWGNDYQMHLDRANNVLRQYADAQDMEAIKRYENDLPLVRFLSKIGAAMGEHNYIRTDNTARTAEERQTLKAKAEEYQRIYLDPSKDEGEKKRAYQQAQAIYDRLYGTEEVSGTGAMSIR